MKLKFLHLNIQKGRFFENISKFLKSRRFDIINFQEVAGGIFGFKPGDCFKKTQKLTGHKGILAPSLENGSSYFGNAVFFDKKISLQKYKVIWLKKNRKPVPRGSKNFQKFPRNALACLFQINGKVLEIINAHLAWGPTPYDKKFKLKQGRILLDYIKKLKRPFILSGDFNLIPESSLVKSLEKYSRNLTVEKHIKNTLNPKTHRAGELFPEGLAVDYVFVSKKIKVKKFRLVNQPDLSDHLALTLEFDI